MKNIDNIFKNAFEGFEETVDPSLWSAIEGSIPSAGAAAGTGASGGFLSSLGAKIVAAVVVGAAIVTTAIVVNQEPKVEVANNEQVTTPQEITKDTEVKEEDTSTEIAAEVEFEDISHPIVENDSEKQTITIEDYLGSDKEPESQGSATENEVAINNDSTTENHNPASSEGKPEIENDTSASQEDSSKETISIDSEFVFRIPNEENPKYVLFQGESQEDVRYLWDFGNGQISDELNPSVVYNDFGTYEVTLTVIDSSGNQQKSTQEVIINLEPIIEIPNIFTPNEDNLNSTFDLMAKSENVTLRFVRIMNPQNQVVYIYSEDSESWNGLNTKGEVCPEGQYAFVAIFQDLKGDSVQKTGTVQLVR